MVVTCSRAKAAGDTTTTSTNSTTSKPNLWQRSPSHRPTMNLRSYPSTIIATSASPIAGHSRSPRSATARTRLLAQPRMQRYYGETREMTEAIAVAANHLSNRGAEAEVVIVEDEKAPEHVLGEKVDEGRLGLEVDGVAGEGDDSRYTLNGQQLRIEESSIGFRPRLYKGRRILGW
ncbi:hypothetical protein PSPO01_13905 [Paraphaeosphaeria sporulosa]